MYEVYCRHHLQLRWAGSSSRDELLQLGLGHLLEIGATADELLSDVDVWDGSLAVQLLEVGLNLGYGKKCQHSLKEWPLLRYSHPSSRWSSLMILSAREPQGV